MERRSFGKFAPEEKKTQLYGKALDEFVEFIGQVSERVYILLHLFAAFSNLSGLLINCGYAPGNVRDR